MSTTRSHYEITGEVNKSERDIKDGGGPYGDRRRRKRRGVREVNVLTTKARGHIEK
jgi:hypothetical protein